MCACVYDACACVCVCLRLAYACIYHAAANFSRRSIKHYLILSYLSSFLPFSPPLSVSLSHTRTHINTHTIAYKSIHTCNCIHTCTHSHLHEIILHEPVGYEQAYFTFSSQNFYLESKFTQTNTCTQMKKISILITMNEMNAILWCSQTDRLKSN